MEKKILPPLLQEFEPATFQSRVRRSDHWAIPSPMPEYVVQSIFPLRSALFIIIIDEVFA